MIWRVILFWLLSASLGIAGFAPDHSAAWGLRGNPVKLTADDNLTGVTEAGHSARWTYDAYDRVSSYQDVNG